MIYGINGGYNMKEDFKINRKPMLKKLLALLLMVTTMCAMVGCSSKGPVSINKFEKRARRYDFGCLQQRDDYAGSMV